MPSQTPNTPRQEARLHNRFLLRRRLGIGGMGVVYEAFDERRGLLVALKTLQNLSPEGLISLKREFRLAAELRHPNLVRLYDLVVSSSGCSFSMEIVEGQDLLTCIRGESVEAPTAVDVPTTGPGYHTKKAPVAWVHEVGATYDGVRLLRILPQICAALDALHQAGLVHRDIKPNNILVTREGQAKLLDFGIAQSSQDPDTSEEDFVPGTPHYMSPEQVRGERVGAPSDLYSLGVLLYVLLCGRPPFLGKNSLEIARRHVCDTPPLPSQFAPGIPRQLEVLCLDLLRKDPSLRPTARQVASRLAALGAPIPSFGRMRPRSFVGRDKEIAALMTLCERVKRGERCAVLMGGESGTGKSALCAEVVRTLSELGWRVVTAHCYEREFLTYNAIDPLLDTMATALRARPGIAQKLPAGIEALATMFPTLQQIPGVAPAEELGAAEGRKKAREALPQLFQLYREGHPLALFIDDLQWADRDSIELLCSLFASSSLPVLLLGTYYASEIKPGHPLEMLLGEPYVSSFPLSPFGVEEVRDLVGEEVDDELVLRIAREARGNAFLATELGAALLSGESSAGDLRALFSSRLSSLGRAPRVILEALSVAGAAVSFPVLQAVTGFDAPTLSLALDDLRGARWLREVDSSRGEEEAYDIYHNRIREVVYASLSEEVRRQWHYRFYQVLGERGEPEAVAEHALRFGERWRAAPWLLKAARKAALQLAPERAAELYQRALEVAGSGWVDAQTAREERAQVLDRAGGRYAEAAQAYREAARHVEAEAAARLLLWAAEADLKRGAIAEALSAGVQALAPYEKLHLPKSNLRALLEAGWRLLGVNLKLNRLKSLPGRPSSERSSLRHSLYLRLGSVITYFDLFRSMVFNTRSVSSALSEGSDDEVLGALAFYSFFTALRRGRKNFARARALLARCQEWLPATRDPEIPPWVKGLSGMVDTLSGHFAEARERLPEALSGYRAVGRIAGHEVTAMMAYAGVAEAAAGYPSRGVDLLVPLFDRAVAERDLLILSAFTPVIIWNRLLIGDLGGARAAAQVMPWNRPTPSLLGVALPLRQAALLLAEGSAAEAVELLEKLLKERFQNGLAFLKEYHLRCRLFLGAAHLAVARHTSDPGTRKASLARLRKVVRPVLRSDDPVLEGVGFRLVGLAEEARGRKKSAQALLARAVSSLEEHGEAFELAAALLAHGAHTGNQEEISRGKAILERGGGMDPALREGAGWEWQ